MAASTENMLWQHRRIPADTVARDFSVTAQAFADTFVQYVAASQDGETPALIEARRRESYALIWATIEATFVASAFTEAERMKVVPMIRDTLVPSWRKYQVDSDEFVARVRERSADYLRHQDALSQIRTATGFMAELVSNLDADAVKLLPVRTLSALLAHRMLSDVRRLNEIKSGHTVT